MSEKRSLTLSSVNLFEYRAHLLSEEKSEATTQKYMHDISVFYRFASFGPITKELVLEYKKHLYERYAPASVNSMLVALNCFLRYMGAGEMCVRLLKIQRQIFCNEEKELSREEYRRLLKAASGTRLSYIMQTICQTGIRVSELRFITVEAVNRGRAAVSLKNKTRIVLIPLSLQRVLREYIKKQGLKAGPVFVGRCGKPLDRSGIWREMKALSKKAEVSPDKIFPHNLRHLFARTFYNIEKDIVRLADLLGHSSINTTRIYTVEAGAAHIASLERVGRALAT